MSNEKKSLAIAYAIKSKNRKKMAGGGPVDDAPYSKQGAAEIQAGALKPRTIHESIENIKSALGVHSDPEPTPSPSAGMATGGMVDRIRARQKLAMGGEVSFGDNEDEIQHPNFDDQNHEAVLKENYGDEVDHLSEPGSNEISVDLDDGEDEGDDMVSRLRKRMKSRRGL